MSQVIYLSHMLDTKTPSYGNRSVFELENKRSITHGDHANESFLHMPVHLGTHIDMPIHFYSNAQSIENYPAEFWIFEDPLIIEIQPQSAVIFQEIIIALEQLPTTMKKTCDLLIVKTGIGAVRHLSKFWEYNPGFSPDLYTYFRSKMPSLKVFGFDGVSLTGFQNREVGKIAHKKFLNPEAPILLLEDMKLDKISFLIKLNKVIIAPLRIANSDGLPCTVLGFI